jgi:hypothetical protein
MVTFSMWDVRTGQIPAHTSAAPATSCPRSAIGPGRQNDRHLQGTLRSDQVLELAAAVDYAQHSQAQDRAWQAELAYWTGDARPGGTGVPDAAIPDRPTQTTVPGRDFGHHGQLPVSAAHQNDAVFVILYGNADEPLNWLLAGEALTAGWLTAVDHGVSVAPHSAPIEAIGTRQAMRAMLASIGYPYLALRLGAIDPAGTDPPHTPRLPTDQIIDRF